MANTAAVTTLHRIVTVAQAAELNELFLTWYDLTHEDTSNRIVALRACDWANCDASSYDYCKKVLEDGIAAFA